MLAVALGCVLVMAAAAAGGQAAASSRQLALGVSSLPWDSLQEVDAFTASVGRAPASWTIWSTWGGKDAAFPDAAFMDGLRSRGIVPLIFWQPANPPSLEGNPYTYKAIARGDFDTYIRTWARAAKAYGGPTILRFAPEMDGSWFPWSVSRYGNTPARFVKAWRHIWDIFHKVGATKVQFLWSPAQPCRCQSGIYPGDSYVDFVGFTAYNWANASHPWRGMGAILRDKIKHLDQLTHKPVIVAELGTAGTGGDKPLWISEGYPKAYRSYPQIKAIVYFDVDMRWDSQPDWQFQAPPTALKAYRKLVAQSHFRGSLE